MAGITFAIGFFVAFVIKIVFITIQRLSIVNSVDYKRDMQRAKRIHKIRKGKIFSDSNPQKSNELLLHYYDSRIPINKEAGILDTNEIIEFYYGKS
jgi:hypothetical protein